MTIPDKSVSIDLLLDSERQTEIFLYLCIYISARNYNFIVTF